MQETVDVLNRGQFIDMLYQLVNTMSDLKQGKIFSIDGTWGYGKTYVLEELERRLSPVVNEETYDDKFYVFHYNCWQYDYYEEPSVAIISAMLGKLLEAFKELIKEGLCWFPRLMRWKTSKWEVAPVFLEKSAGYSYSLYGYMNVDTKEYYYKESVQWEITAGNRTGTVEQMDVNVEAMARDLQEILRIGAEQKRLWEVYERR